MSRSIHALSLLAVACARSPDPCAALCARAAAAWRTCLDARGQDWPDAGYADAGDFLASCDTFAWELRQLEADARAAGAVDAFCADGAATLADRPAADTGDTGDPCAPLSAVDWAWTPQ